MTAEAAVTRPVTCLLGEAGSPKGATAPDATAEDTAAADDDEAEEEDDDDDDGRRGGVDEASPPAIASLASLRSRLESTA
jgi:hypothetical protein